MRQTNGTKWIKFILVAWAIMAMGSRLQAAQQYRTVFFKCGATATLDAYKPSVSQGLYDLLGTRLYYTKCTATGCYVFCNIPTETNDLILAIQNGLSPLSKEEENLYADIIKLIEEECVLINAGGTHTLVYP